MKSQCVSFEELTLEASLKCNASFVLAMIPPSRRFPGRQAVVVFPCQLRTVLTPAVPQLIRSFVILPLWATY